MGAQYLFCEGLDLMPQPFGMKNFNRLSHSHEFVLKFVFSTEMKLIYGIRLRYFYSRLGVVQRKMVKIVPLGSFDLYNNLLHFVIRIQIHAYYVRKIRLRMDIRIKLEVGVGEFGRYNAVERERRDDSAGVFCHDVPSLLAFFRN